MKVYKKGCTEKNIYKLNIRYKVQTFQFQHVLWLVILPLPDDCTFQSSVC